MCVIFFFLNLTVLFTLFNMCLFSNKMAEIQECLHPDQDKTCHANELATEIHIAPKLGEGKTGMAVFKGVP